MSNYDLNRHKKGDKVKWFFTGLAFFLVIITIVGMCLQLWGKGKVKPSEWFKHEETEQTTPTTPENENSAVVSDGDSNGMLLVASAIPLNSYEEYGVSALAENAQLITATFTPEATTNKNVTWSCSDTSGKVTVTPVSGNPLQATVAVSGGFDTQVVITCTSQANSAIKATCTVDYVKSVVGQFYEYDIANPKFEAWTFAQDLVFQNGTINPTSLKGDVYFAINGSLYNYLKNKHSSVSAFKVYNDIDLLNSSVSCMLKDLFGTSDESEINAIYEDIAIYYYGQEWITIGCLNYDDVYSYYNGVEAGYEEGTFIEVNCILENTNSIVVNATSLSLSDGGLIFGANGAIA